MSDILDKLAEDNTKKDPFIILMGLYLTASSGKMLDDEHYYRWIRLRKLITLKHIQSKKFYNILERVFTDGCAYRFVQLLEEIELLEFIFPSIYALIKVDGGHYHNETVYSHVMGALRALDKLNIPWYVKLSALYHDCGKQKWVISEEGKRRFTNHAAFGAQLVECDLRRLKFPRGIISIAKTLVCYHMSHMNDKNDIHVHSLRKVNPPHIPSVKDLEINGYDLMKLFPDIQGRCIGYVLKKLFEYWQLGQIENKYDILIEKAKEIKSEYKNECEKKYKNTTNKL